MTDGPHKSLPMKPVWRKVAERAWNPTFSSEQLGEAIPRALLQECDPAIVRMVALALTTSDQGTLFEESPHELAMRVNAVRSRCPGSMFGNNLIDATVYEIWKASPGSPNLRIAVQVALQETASGAFRGIEEHGLRKEGLATANTLRQRLDAAKVCIDYGLIQDQLMSPSKNGNAFKSVPKRTGLDEGVSLG